MSAETTDRHRIAMIVPALLLVGVVGGIDYLTGPEIAFSIFYLFPVSLAAWFVGWRISVVVAFASAVTWWIADVTSLTHPYSHVFIPYWNAVMRLGFFLVVAALLRRLKIVNEGLEATVEARTAALSAEVAERQRAEQEKAALLSVARDIAGTLDMQTLLDRLCLLTTEVLDCDATHAVLWSPEEDAYVPAASYGYSAEVGEALRMLRLPRHLLQEALGALASDGVRQRPIAEIPGSTLRAVSAEAGLTVALGIALRRGDEVIGFLSACHRGRREPFSPQQERIAQGISHLASLALDNARLLDEIGRANRLKSEFVATMSHELRTPLNIIVGYNDLMRDDAFGALSAEQRSIVERISCNAEQLLELINATLDITRLESGRMPIDLHEIQVPALLRELDGETRELQRKPGVETVWRIAPDVGSLVTDELKLKVVIKNLLVNALKFTTRGSVTVSAASYNGGGVEISVADTGIGIPSEALAVIFEPFRQADSTVHHAFGGVGLGLYITRRLLERLGGSVDVESKPGSGSTFRVRIPPHAPAEGSGAIDD